MNPLKHLIIGNGAAGISAAEKLRQLDYNCEITIISIEDTPVYTKFLLPDYIGDKVKKGRLILRDFNYYSDNRIELILKGKVASIDVKSKKVYLQDGRVKEFDKLLVAVGGSPIIPRIEGLERVDYHTINSIEDADNIKSRVVEGQKAVVVGAGLTGIEVAFALKRLGMKVTLVEREQRLLAQQLDGKSAEFLVEQMRNEGVELLFEKNVRRAEGKDKKHIEFSDGEKLEFDMLFITIGTRPNLKVISGTGIKTGRGILVNEYMETSEKDIYAAGDVAETVNVNSEGYVSSYIWMNALAQGKCAAFNMAGQPQTFSYDAANNNVVRLRDIPFVSMGMINPDEKEYESLIYSDVKSYVYKKIVIKDNKVVGMIFLGDTASANIVGDLARKASDISNIRSIILEKDFLAKYRELK